MERVLFIKAENFESAYNRGMEFIKDSVKDFDKRVNNNIVLAFEEAFVNILKYNSNKKDLKVFINIKLDQNEFKVRIKDNGEKFDPLLKEEPDFSLSADEMDIGGMGIYILKKVTDEVEYEYKENCNILKFGVKLNDKT